VPGGLSEMLAATTLDEHQAAASAIQRVADTIATEQEHRSGHTSGDPWPSRHQPAHRPGQDPVQTDAVPARPPRRIPGQYRA